MIIFPPQRYARSCGLACISFILSVSEDKILHENPDMLSISKLNFIGLYCSEIVEILSRYGFTYTWFEYDISHHTYLEQNGTIVYLEQIDHYLVKFDTGWGDSYRNRRGIPEFGYWKDLPYEPSYVIYRS